MVDVVYVYNGPGVGQQALTQTLTSLKTAVQNFYSVRTLDDRALQTGIWQKDAVLLVIPGGADVPYSQKLNGKGNQLIRRYIEQGGSYLGICAGSYYAGAFLEWEKGKPTAIIGPRELAFFPGIVRGPILADYVYDSEKGARATTIQWLAPSKPSVKRTHFTVYYNGGGYFVDAHRHPNTTVLAVYDDLADQPSAIVECMVGKGMAILSAVHIEFDPSFLDRHNPDLQDKIKQLEAGNRDRNALFVHILNRLGLKV